MRALRHNGECQLRRSYLSIMKNLITKSYFSRRRLISKRESLNTTVANSVRGTEEGKKVLIKVRLALISYHFVAHAKFCFLVKALADLICNFCN